MIVNEQSDREPKEAIPQDKLKQITPFDPEDLFSFALEPHRVEEKTTMVVEDNTQFKFALQESTAVVQTKEIKPPSTQEVNNITQEIIITVDDILDGGTDQSKTNPKDTAESSSNPFQEINKALNTKVVDPEVINKLILNAISGTTTTLDSFTQSNPEIQVNESKIRGVYLVVGDLHLWHKNISTRKDYYGECIYVILQIIKILYTHPEINNVILSGDVFHQGFDTLDNAEVYRNVMILINELMQKRGGKLYAVPGNHEYTYVKNNLFWHLVKENIILTPLQIEDNGVVIALEAFKSSKSSRVKDDNLKADIIITHNEVLPPEVKDEERKISGKRIWTTNKCSNFDRFNCKHLFVAHMHMISGIYYLIESLGEKTEPSKMTVQYLSTLGRTNIDEVRDDFLVKKLPILTISDVKGEYSVTQEEIVLKDYKSTVVEAAVARNKKATELKKVLNAVKLEKIQDNPIKTVQMRFNNETITEMLEEASNNNESRLLAGILSEISNVYEKYKNSQW